MSEPLTQTERDALQVQFENKLIDAVTRSIRELSWCGMWDGTAISGLCRSLALLLILLIDDENDRAKVRSSLTSIISKHEKHLLSIINAQEAHK